jgi:hypothetical protein
MNISTITIPESYKDYIDATIVRASYLFPSVTISISSKPLSFKISGIENAQDFESFKKDFFNILYRERIYSETLSIRKTIYGSKD